MQAWHRGGWFLKAVVLAGWDQLRTLIGEPRRVIVAEKLGKWEGNPGPGADLTLCLYHCGAMAVQVGWPLSHQARHIFSSWGSRSLLTHKYLCPYSVTGPMEAIDE